VNDPDRGHRSDGLDDDAIFADIVAHFLTDVAEDERPAQPPAEAAAADDRASNEGLPDAPRDTSHPEATDRQQGEVVQPREGVQPGAGIQPGEGIQPDFADRPGGDQAPWPITGPPVLPGTGEPGTGEPVADPSPQVWRAHQVDDEYEEHFEPSPVAPLPVGDLQFWAIIAGMVGGPLLLVYLVFFNRDASSYWTLAALFMSVAGFALLISRRPGHQEDDDDGARL